MNNGLIVKILGTVSPYPKDDKNCPGYLFKYNNYNILFDCGNGCTRLLNFKEDLNNLKIFISHLHPDHYGDLISLLQAIYVYRKYGYTYDDIELFIPVTKVMEKEHYTDTDGWGSFRTIEKDIIDFKYIKKYAKSIDIKLHEYDNCFNIKYDNISIENILVPHQIDSYAFKLKTPDGVVVYSSDTGSKNNLRKFARGCNLFICESTFLKGQFRMEDYHLYAYEAASIAKDANVRKLLLTHFWPEENKYKYLDEAKNIFANTEVAEEGKEYILRK